MYDLPEERGPNSTMLKFFSTNGIKRHNNKSCIRSSIPSLSGSYPALRNNNFFHSAVSKFLRLSTMVELSNNDNCMGVILLTTNGNTFEPIVINGSYSTSIIAQIPPNKIFSWCFTNSLLMLAFLIFELTKVAQYVSLVASSSTEILSMIL